MANLQKQYFLRHINVHILNYWYATVLIILKDIHVKRIIKKVTYRYS